MAKYHRIELGSDVFSVRSGRLLLDGALESGVGIPHDCRAGRCGSCAIEVCHGTTLGGETGSKGVVRACQARVFSDLKLSIEAIPPSDCVRGTLDECTDLTADVVELAITPQSPVTILAGQYCRFTFNGFPTRCFTPTASLDGRTADGRIRLQVKRVRQGRVSTNLGGKIGAGHRLTIEGPFGHGFLRPNLQNRLVLVAGGTGFAPIWAIADAALRENPLRRIALIAGVRKLSSFYMGRALDLISRLPNVDVTATAEEHQTEYCRVRFGDPLAHIPQLLKDDIIYAAGSPAMVKSIGDQAADIGATFYSDPFESDATMSEDWLTRAIIWLRTG